MRTSTFRNLRQLAAAILLGVVWLGSAPASAQDSSEVRIFLSSTPTQYDQLLITIEELSFHSGGKASGGGGSGWSSLPLATENADLDSDGTDDLVVNPDGTVTLDLAASPGTDGLVAVGDLSTGNYQVVRIRIRDAQVINGEDTYDLDVRPKNTPVHGSFSVGVDQLIALYLEFDADKSVKSNGQGPHKLRPFVNLTSQDLVIEATIHLGDSELGDVEASPAGDIVAVSNETDSTIDLIDAQTNEVVATVPVQSGTNEIEFTPDGGLLLIANTGTPSTPGDTVTLIDTGTLSSESVTVGSGPAVVACAPSGNTVYVLNRGGLVPDNTVSVIDISNPAVPVVTATVTVGSVPHSVEFTDDGLTAAVTSAVDHTVELIDVATNTSLDTVAGIAGPSDVVSVPGTDNIAVANSYFGGAVTLISASTSAITSIDSWTGAVSFLEAHPDGSRIYALSNEATRLVVLDATDGSYILSEKLGDSEGSDVNPEYEADLMVLASTDSGPQLIIGAAGGTLVSFDIATDTQTGYLDVGGEITDLTYNPLTAEVSATVGSDVLVVDPDSFFAGTRDPGDEVDFEQVTNPTNLPLPGDTVIQDVVVLVDDGLSDEATSLAIDSGEQYRGQRIVDAHLVNIVNRFYGVVPDVYDYVVIFFASDWRDLVDIDGFPLDIEGDGYAFFHQWVRSFTRGIGQDSVRMSNQASALGYPTTRMQSVVFLNDMAEFNSDLTLLFGGRPAISLYAHELGHRFAAYADLSAGTILGSKDKHWKRTFNSSGSALGGTDGNLWADLGETVPGSGIHQFQVLEQEAHYGDWDEYLLGLLDTSSVAPTFRIDNPSSTLKYSVGQIIEGERFNLTIGDLIADNGPRLPESALAQKTWRLGVCLIVPPVDPTPTVRQEDLDEIRTLTDGVQNFWSMETQDRGRLVWRNSAGVVESGAADSLLGTSLSGGVVLPAGQKLYATDSLAGVVRVFDANPESTTFLDELTTIPVGNQPAALAASADGASVVVTNATASQLSVIDTASDSISSTIPLVGAATAVAVGRHGPADGLAYVAEGSLVEVVDIGLGQVVGSFVPTSAGVHDLSVSPDGDVVVYSSGDAVLGHLTARHTVTGTETALAFAGSEPGAVAIVQLESNPHNTKDRAEASSTPPALVYATFSDRVRTFDLTTDPTTQTFNFRALPINPDTGGALVPDIVTSGAPTDVAITPSGSMAFAVSADTGDVDLIETGSHTIQQTLDGTAGDGLSVAISPDESAFRISESELIDIGAPAGSDVWVLDMNQRGDLVGRVETTPGDFTTRRAFLWTVAGGFQDLGLLPGGIWSVAWKINDLGEVVGNSSNCAFRWNAQSGMVDLGELVPGVPHVAIAINNNGLIAGKAGNSTVGYTLFLWDQTSGYTDLGTFTDFIDVRDLSDSGFMVGIEGRKSFLWSAASGMVDLGIHFGDSSATNGVNEAGQVIGGSFVFLGGVSRAYLLTPEDRVGGDGIPDTWFDDTNPADGFNDLMVDLGDLGGSTVQPHGINAAGHVLGFAYLPSDDRTAFLWTPEDGLIDLGDFGADQSNFFPVVPFDLNDKGQMAIFVSDGPSSHRGYLRTGRVGVLR